MMVAPSLDWSVRLRVPSHSLVRCLAQTTFGKRCRLLLLRTLAVVFLSLLRHDLHFLLIRASILLPAYAFLTFFLQYLVH